METYTEPAMPAHSDRRGTIMMSVGLLIVGLVAGYLMGKGISKNTVAVQSLTPSISAATSTVWKTYQNSEGYFSIQYPPQYTAAQSGLDNGGYYDEIRDDNPNAPIDIIINIARNNNIASLKTYVDNLSTQGEKDAQNSAAGVTFTVEPITVDGVQGYVLFAAEGSAVANVDVRYYFLKNKTLYILESGFSYANPEFKQTLRDIVATFHFLK